MDQVEAFLGEEGLRLLYITTTTCNVCKSILPKLESLLESFPHIAAGKIEADQLQEAKGKFLVFSVPAILLYYDNKELHRSARFIQFDELRSEFERFTELTT
jgi:thiol-disulfide isomerase/thioredoxin